METENKAVSQEKMKHMREVLSEINLDFSDFSLIQDNNLLFTVNDVSFRVVMPTQKEFNDANEKKNACYVRLIQSDVCMTKAKLRQILKDKQDIDIEELERQKRQIQTNLEGHYFTLYDAKEDDEIVELKSRMADLKSDFIRISTEVVNLLSASIEDQVEKEYIEYLTYLCTQKHDETKDGEYKKYWNSYEDFQNDNTAHVVKAINQMTYLLMNVEDR